MDGLFIRMNSLLNRTPGRFTRDLQIHFDNLSEPKYKLAQASRLLSRYTEFVPEEVRLPKFTEWTTL